MTWSIFFLTIAGALVAIYALIWAVLLVMFKREERRIISTFESAFKDGLIKTKVVTHNMTSVIQLSWPDGNGSQHIRVNGDGELVTTVRWEDGSNDLSRLKNSKAIIAHLQPLTKEVAAMHKLQHGPLKHFTDGMATTSGSY